MIPQRKRAGVATKYLGSQTLLTGVSLGGITAAGVTHPHAAAILGPVALLLGLVLGYAWRDAVGDWRGQRALAKLRAGQAAQIAEVKRRLEAGQLSPEQIAELQDRLLGTRRQPAQPPQEVATP